MTGYSAPRAQLFGPFLFCISIAILSLSLSLSLFKPSRGGERTLFCLGKHTNTPCFATFVAFQKVEKKGIDDFFPLPSRIRWAAATAKKKGTKRFLSVDYENGREEKNSHWPNKQERCEKVLRKFVARLINPSQTLFEHNAPEGHARAGFAPPRPPSLSCPLSLSCSSSPPRFPSPWRRTLPPPTPACLSLRGRSFAAAADERGAAGAGEGGRQKEG